MPTHEVTNQVPPLVGTDITTHVTLLEGLHREGAGWAEDEVRTLAAMGNSERWQEAGRLANEHPPVLRTHDRYGNRVDEVEYHPAWHSLLRLGVENGLHALPWREPVSGAHVARAAGFMLLGQVEAGVGCPLSMTFAAVPAVRAEPELAAEGEPRLTSLNYDDGALCGMAMTERQGGSDVRANETTARRIAPDE